MLIDAVGTYRPGAVGVLPLSGSSRFVSDAIFWSVLCCRALGLVPSGAVIQVHKFHIMERITIEQQLRQLRALIDAQQRVIARLSQKIGLQDQGLIDIEREDALDRAARGDYSALKRHAIKMAKGVA